MRKYILLSTAVILAGLLILGIFVTPADKNQEGMNTDAKIAPKQTRSPYITEYTLPTPESGPMAITVDHNGEVWIAATNITKLVRFNPVSKGFREFKIPKLNFTSIWGMVVDNHGSIWFTSTNDNSIWSFNPAENGFKQYPVPTKDAFPLRIAMDGEGQIWFTELYGGKLGQIKPSTGEIVEYKVPRNRSGPTGLSVDAEGNIWFADAYANMIGKFDPRTYAFTEYPSAASIFSPTGIGVDSRGRVWFLEHGGSLFGEFSQSDNSTVKYATSITGRFSTTLPYWLSIDKSGNIWFNEHSGNRIARFDPSNEVLVEYELPKGQIGVEGIVNALHFTIAPDGNVWFSEWTENKIGIINVSKPIPFQMNVDDRRVTATPGSDVKVGLSLSGTADRHIVIQTSGTFSFTGKLLNATTQFSPQQVLLMKNSSYKSDLTIKLGKSLVPGEYVLTIGASDGDVNYSVMVHVDVKGKI